VFERKKYLIDMTFQGKFALVFAIAAVIGNVVSTAIFIILSREKLESLQWSVHVSAQSTGEIMQSLSIQVGIFNLILVLVLIFITGIWMMKKTRGPLYRISNDLEKVCAGDFSSPIVLRQKDEFKDVADALNDMIENTRARLNSFKNSYEDISRNILDLEVKLAKGFQIREESEKLAQSIKKLRSDLELNIR